MSTVLLFGATGFIGAHVRAELATVADLVCPTRAECDLAAVEPPALTALIRAVRPAAVVTCAGRASGAGHQLVHDNAVVTGKLIEAVSAGAPSARLVRLGSAAEYGAVPPGRRSREDDPAAPVNEYGWSQLAATRLVELACAAGRVDAAVLRVFNPVGPGLARRYALGRAADLLRTAPGGDGRIAMGPLDAYRDFVDVRDVAAAVRAAVLAPSLPERVFNVGTGHAVRTGDAVAALAEVAGRPGAIDAGDPPHPADPPLPGAGRVPWSCADPVRSAGVLGWTAAYGLRDAVASLWADFSAVGDSQLYVPV